VAEIDRAGAVVTAPAPVGSEIKPARERRDLPWWTLIIAAIWVWMAYKVVTDDTYRQAFDRIGPGWWLTVRATITAFVLALVIGLVVGLGRLSRNPIARNLAIAYIELIRGVPILVLIFTISYVIVPELSTALGFDNSSIDFFWRAVSALAIIYGAYLAEVFRAGIESIPRGQTEAGRSLGLSGAQTMRRIVLPQAVRNMTPAIGNDLIAMLKDSSLLSVLGIRELTQLGRLYASSTFEFRASYLVLTLFYLTMTLILSALVNQYRRRTGLTS
jgi:polar amino acid transport system permease protein